MKKYSLCCKILNSSILFILFYFKFIEVKICYFFKIKIKITKKINNNYQLYESYKRNIFIHYYIKLSCCLQSKSQSCPQPLPNKSIITSVTKISLMINSSTKRSHPTKITLSNYHFSSTVTKLKNSEPTKFNKLLMLLSMMINLNSMLIKP